MYGIFSDEGLIEGDFLTESAAAEAIVARYSDDDELHIGFECDEHPGNEKDSCEECNGTDDGECDEIDE